MQLIKVKPCGSKNLIAEKKEHIFTGKYVSCKYQTKELDPTL